jgi:hypothetical protein
MPVAIAVVSAVASVSAGVAAVSAGSALVGGLMIAGGIASGLGAITGNKTLQQIGMVAGLAGGVAGFASGAWDSAATDLVKYAGSSTDATAGNYVNAMDAASDAAGAPGTVAGSAVDTASTASRLATDGLDTKGVVSSNAPNLAQDAATESGLRDALGASAPEVNAPTSVEQMTATANANDPFASSAAPSDSAFAAGGDRVSDKFTSTRVFDQTTQTSGSGSLWETMKKLPGWIEKNKETAKLASGLVGGAMKSYGDQAALKSRYALEDEYRQKQQQRYSQSIIGLHMPTYQAPSR